MARGRRAYLSDETGRRGEYRGPAPKISGSSDVSVRCRANPPWPLVAPFGRGSAPEKVAPFGVENRRRSFTIRNCTHDQLDVTFDEQRSAGRIGPGRPSTSDRTPRGSSCARAPDRERCAPTPVTSRRSPRLQHQPDRESGGRSRTSARSRTHQARPPRGLPAASAAAAGRCPWSRDPLTVLRSCSRVDTLCQ